MQRMRRSEQSRKSPAHAAHDRNFHILFVQADHLANLVSDASPQLEGGALPAGGTAADMGQKRSQENGRSRAKGDFRARMDRFDYHICPAVFIFFQNMVDTRYQKSADRQKKYRPWIIPEIRGYP